MRALGSKVSLMITIWRFVFHIYFIYFLARLSLSSQLKFHGNLFVKSVTSLAHDLWLFIDPIELGMFVSNDVFLAEPQSNLLFRIFNAIRTVAHITANILFFLVRGA